SAMSARIWVLCWVVVMGGVSLTRRSHIADQVAGLNSHTGHHALLCDAIEFGLRLSLNGILRLVAGTVEHGPGRLVLPAEFDVLELQGVGGHSWCVLGIYSISN